MTEQPRPAPAPAIRIAVLVAGIVGLALATCAGVFMAHRSAARRTVRAGQLATASRHLDRCLALWPRSSTLQLEAARVARRSGDLAQAEQRLAAVAKRAPRSPDVQLEQRLLQVQRGEVADVEIALKDLVAKGHPDAALVREALAAGYLASGRLQEAQALLDEILRQDPRNVPAMLMMGQVSTSLQRDEEALPHLRRAVEVAPGSIAAHFALAKVLMSLGFEREAAGHFEWVRRQRPHDPDVLLGLAVCRANAGERPEAARLLDELLRHHPSHVGGLTERGRLALFESQPVQAEELARRALTVAPTDAMAWQVMANALHAQGNEADAARALDNHCGFDGAAAQLRYLAGELDERPEDPDLLAKVGEAYLRLNMAAQAEQALTRALSIDPNHAAARQLLQQMRRRGRTVR